MINWKWFAFKVDFNKKKYINREYIYIYIYIYNKLKWGMKFYVNILYICDI